MTALLHRLLDTRRPLLVISFFVALCTLPAFFLLPPSDRDESRFAQATKQMLETGDFLNIRFLDTARNKKPVGIYWAQAASVELVGAARTAIGLPPVPQNPIWPYRIPSLLGLWGAAVATFLLGRALVGQRTALLAALMLSTSLVAVVEAHIAKTDAALTAAVTVAMLLLARAHAAPESFTRRQAAGFWLALGVGVLLKGPIAPMVALLAVTVLAAIERRGRWLGALRPQWGLPLMLAVVAPWFILIGIETQGAFFRESLGGDLGSKLQGADEKHGGPPGYHLLLATLTLFPASLLLWHAAPGIWATRREALTRFMLAWILPTWLVFELAPTKLPHYVLPTFPAILLLLAAWVLNDQRRAAPRWLAVPGIGLWGVVIGAFIVGPPLAGLLADRMLDPLWLLAPLAAIGLAWLAAALLRGGEVPGFALAGLFAAPVLYGSVLGATLARIDSIWIAPRVAEAVRAAGGGPLASAGFHEPSLPFLLGTNTRLVRDGAEAAAFLAATPGGLALVRDRNDEAFRAARPSARLVSTIAGFNYSRGQRVRLLLYAD
jgi:4-amino-4-deoxy-L-arabinose transferase-like glycosyltransferase